MKNGTATISPRTNSTSTKDKRPVLWEATPKQSEFLSCPAREVLFSGSVGSGKTDAILMAGLSQVNNGKHRALILRRTFPMLRDLIGRSHELFLPLNAVFSKQESVWTFPSGARVEFGFLDADEDKYRYMGRQFSMIGFDELTSWPGDGTDNQGQPCNSAYLYMMSRLRAVEGSGLRMESRATCTPGNVGHGWVKSRWNIPNDGSSSEVVDPATGFRRVFIRATIKDNPYLAGTSYEKSLEALPEVQRKALLEGRWDVFEGAVFSEFDPRIHVVDGFEIPEEWEVWRSGDDGFSAPAAIHWLTRDPLFDTIYVVREIYQRGLTAHELARAIREVDATFERDEPITGVIDSAAFADIGQGGRAQQMNELGCNWQPSPKGPGSRVAGWGTLHNRLAIRSDSGEPGLKIFRCCRNLIRTLPSLVYSTTHPEDVSENCESHAADGLRYALTRKVIFFRRMKVKGI